MADALEDAKAAHEELADQTHAARMWFIAHGGNGVDLEDEQSATKSMNSLLEALSGSK